ncbi:MAG: hypothetical protein ACREF3_12175 [Acetobacteraceae bacterium]
MLGKALFAGALVAGVFYAYPLINEHAGNVCQALEDRYIAMAAPASALHWPVHAVELAVARTMLEPLSKGSLAAAAIKRQYPALPSQVGCAVSYWTTMIDPRVQAAVGRAMN